ncbi:MAG: recombinase family protein, partial [Planctomycetaceae bacterium]|nr:recombinase family protein [Planctomycetaceae bacterium]
MAHSTKSARALLRAAAYLRRSTEKQEKSLADQRAEIERYAADNGYTIVRFYQDDGISGDADRPGFNRMLADATRRDFQFILCWDQDRFSRANSFKTGSFVQALIENGVGLVTLKSGPVDLSTFTGRMMFTIGQEAKHQFLHDLSRNTIRGQLTNARNGFLCGQAAPYGYDKMLVDERGEHRQRVRNGEEFAKPRSWHVTLVASDDPVKVQTLKWLFSEYAGKDIGLRSLAEVLNLKGIPSPRGGKWELGSVREILKNRKYTGDFTWAERREGKYFNAVAGEGEQIRQRTDGSTTVVRNAPENWVLVKDAHEALVT